MNIQFGRIAIITLTVIITGWAMLNNSYAAASDFYSVEWPSDWVTNDLTQNPAAIMSIDPGDQELPEFISFIGGRPKGQTTLYQHAVLVSPASQKTLVSFIKNYLNSNNSALISEEKTTVNGYEAYKFLGQNKASATNRQTLYLVEGKGFSVIIFIHGPGDVEYLNQAADQIRNSFTLAE